ncbi:thiol reductant ABC exporter subunit CydD [Tetragenococcus koreensis]|uniref:Cytochrome bd biosynthesis ABC transporter ATP-binding and permease components cydD n=1 Tax=Tetragenococcus koreensis TaxID=290335 RepID=A0AAN4UBX0_9ENTE|nr:thiol reductant ABC exporter subunit CydD [Tetragenococcus koreensis]MCF1584679.1 thiol reductant ABC exporter subunit CydD [Tetragenococcus koreensis]MCF1614291.1 thiol reductant ABC exporter subunit CydD [Tetragenococcus koreensis]MCF1616483.1 thiol reductant ABC exporter subunit CydD [Tetragenococcus koreensis]MCF1619654.1 thiol reductant ABC exporter subunit CydD [Tetragenococcus koreensis]MCF1621415.1 thiol reductant ABC exporter subunit CydD [Tetragenococcus koreensis]
MIDKAVMVLPNSKKVMGMLAGLAVLQALFIIGQTYMLATVITRLWDGRKITDQLPEIVGFFVIFSARHGVTFLRDKLLDHYAAEQAAYLRKQLLEKVFRVGPKIVQKQGSGNMTTMALDGIEQVENYIHLIFAKMMNMMIVPWPILAVVFYLDVQSGVILLLIFPLIIIFMIVLGYAAQAKADKQYKAFQLLSNHFIDSLRGLDTLKMFGLSKKYGKSIYNTSEEFRKSTMSTLKIGILSTFALDFFTTLAVAIVAVMLGLRLINGLILLFPALAVLILAPEYFLPVREFASDYHATLDGKNAMSAINEVLNEPEMETESLDLPAWDEDSRLSLQNVSVSYENKPVLSVDFSIKGLKKVGIIGMSGSGKSTLINTLSGFLQPDQGKIELNGQKASNLAIEQWQKQLIYIPQDPYVFQLSLKDNLAFYTPEATDTDVLEAVRVAGLSELVAELPDGLDTQLGSGARTLSGGQAQRIALARAFLDKKRKILMFDEPTAHLDIETEVELKERMLPLMEDRLIFFATHRLHWMRQMDEIIVVDQGEIVEIGTFAELSAKKGYFYHLAQQMRGEENA